MIPEKLFRVIYLDGSGRAGAMTFTADSAEAASTWKCLPAGARVVDVLRVGRAHRQGSARKLVQSRSASLI